MCSVERARALGIPEDRWVFPHAGRRLPRAPVRLEPLVAGRDPGHPGRRPDRARAGRGGHRRHRGRRPLLVLPVGGAARRRGARARPRPAADPHGRPVVRRWAVEQLRDARHRHGDGRPAGAPGRARASCGPTAATSRSTRSACTAPSPPRQGFRHASPQDEIDAGPARTLADAGRRGRTGGRRGLHRHARPRRAARDRHRRVPPGRRAAGVGDVERRRTPPTALCDGEWVGRSVTLDADGALHV